MKYVFSTTLALALLATTPALAQDIDVMTQNQYLGANLNDIISAPDPIALNVALVDALKQIAANDYPSRATQLAKLIADRLPDLVGLQEMYSFACIPLAPPAPGEGCDDPDISNAFNDHLDLTMKALVDLEESYQVSASVQNLMITLPVDVDFNLVPDILVTVIDRDVILAQGDVAGSVTPVPYSAFCARPSADGGPGCNYTLVAVADTALGPIAQERGWVGVDATVNGKAYRFVNTHLEVQEPDDGNQASSVFQAAQAGELIATLAASTPPSQSLIVVGDINSSPEDPFIPGPLPLPPPFNDGIVPPYTQFVGADYFPGAGYTDAWDLRPGAVPGYSCCQAEDLLNHQSEHSERIDVIFSIDVPNKVKKARVLGSKVSDKTGTPADGGLWPSDHGSVAAELQF